MQPGGGTPPLPVLQQLRPSLFPGGRWNGGLWPKGGGVPSAGSQSGGRQFCWSFFARRETHRSTEPPPMATLPSLSLSSSLPNFRMCAQCIFCHPGCLSYVILFSVLTALADCSGLLPACIQAVAGLIPGRTYLPLCRSACMGGSEISTGTAALQGAVDAPGLLPLAAFLLDGAGCPVHCQSLPFWRAAGVRPGPYLRAKFLQGVLAAGITMASACLPLSVPAMAPLLSPVPWPPWARFRQRSFLAGCPFCASPKSGRQGDLL